MVVNGGKRGREESTLETKFAKKGGRSIAFYDFSTV